VNVTDIADSADPSMIINSPTNSTYSTNSILFNITATDNFDVSICNYSLNSAANVTMTETFAPYWNATNSSMTQGSHSVIFYCNDSSNNLNATDSRVFFIDSVFPQIGYNDTDTPADNANLSQSYIYVNVSWNETNFQNITYRLYNTTGEVNTTTYTSTVVGINYTGLNDDTYTYNVTLADVANNANTTATRTITLDTGVPSIDFVSPTLASDVSRSQNYVEVNVSVTDSNPDTIIVRLYNGTDSLLQTNYSTVGSDYFFVNYTGLSDGNYSYNATANDTTGASNDTIETRNITLDNTAPSLQLIYPTAVNYTAVQTQFNYSASENTSSFHTCWYSTSGGTSNTTATCGQNISSLDSGQGSSVWIMWVNDSAGNMNSSSVAFFVDSVPPYFTVLENQTILLGSNISYDINATDDGTYGLDAFSIDDTTNFSIDYSNGTITNATALIEYYYVVNVTINDSLGNINTSLWSLNVSSDSTAPTINVQSPTNTTYASGSTVWFNATADEVIDTWILNYNGTNITSFTINTSRTPEDGSHHLLLYANDSVGNLGLNDTVYFRMYTAPSTPGGDTGGGGGGTPSYEWIKERIESWARINLGVVEIIKDFDRDYGIREVEIEVGKTTLDAMIIIRLYGEKPSAVSKEKPGKTYKYLEIIGYNLENIKKIKITLQVEDSWLSENDVREGDIAMFRFDESAEKWNELDTGYQGSDGVDHYYNITLTSLSYYAIGDKISFVAEEPEEEEKTIIPEIIAKEITRIEDVVKNFFNKIGTKTLTWVSVFVLLFVFLLALRVVVKKRVERKIKARKEGRASKAARSVVKYNIGKSAKIKRRKEGVIARTLRRIGGRGPKKYTDKSKRRRIARAAKSVIKYNK
jgi:PGF-pre-PGF domain-containing protein